VCVNNHEYGDSAKLWGHISKIKRNEYQG